MEHIYIWDGEIQSGPYDAMTLRAGLAVGDIAPEDLYWQEGMAGWEPLAGSPYDPTADNPIFDDSAPIEPPEPLELPEAAEPAEPEVVGADLQPALAAAAMPPGLVRHIESQRAAKAQQKAATSETEDAKPRSRSVAFLYAGLAAAAMGLLAGVFWMGFVLTTGLRTRIIMLGIGGVCGATVRWAKGTEQKGVEFGFIGAAGLLLGLLVGYYGLWVEYLRMDVAVAAWEAVIATPDGTEASADAAAEAAAASVSLFSASTFADVIAHWTDYVKLADVLFGAAAVGIAFLLPIADMAEEDDAKKKKA